MELQADCYAGVWGHYAAQRDLLDPGDAEEGLRAAAAIGDDRLQQQAQGRVVPESFTHGSSEQRMTWLRRGLESGRIEACDTFSERDVLDCNSELAGLRTPQWQSIRVSEFALGSCGVEPVTI